jgi:type I restriction enzyme, S subunit
METALLALADACEFVRDGTHSSPERTRIGVPVLSAEHVRDGRLVYATDRFTTERELELFRRRLHPRPGDVLLTIVGTIGRVGLVTDDKPCVFQRSVCVLRPKKAVVDSRYLRYCLESEAVRTQLERETNQVAQAGVYLESLNEIQVPLPRLSEQQRIAGILEQADHLRRTRRYAVALSDTFVISTFHQMFANGSYPKVPLAELVRKERGSFVNGPFGSDLLTSELVSEGVPVIYIRDISDKRYKRISDVCVTSAKAKELETFKVHPDDLLIAKVGDPPGISATYPKGEPVGIVTQDVIRMKLDQNVVMPEYLCAFLNSNEGEQLLKPIIVEGTRARLGLTPFKELSVPLPPVSMQKRFASIVRSHGGITTIHAEALRQAEHLFQSLLQSAFSTGL